MSYAYFLKIGFVIVFCFKVESLIIDNVLKSIWTDLFDTAVTTGIMILGGAEETLYLRQYKRIFLEENDISRFGIHRNLQSLIDSTIITLGKDRSFLPRYNEDNDTEEERFGCKKNVEKIGNIVIIIYDPFSNGTLNIFEDIIEEIRDYSYWNNRAHVVFVMINFHKIDTVIQMISLSKYSEIISNSSLYMRKVDFVIINSSSFFQECILNDSKNLSLLDYYTGISFSPLTRCDEPGIELLGEWDVCKEPYFLENIKNRLRTTLKNFRGCKFPIYVQNNPPFIIINHLNSTEEEHKFDGIEFRLLEEWANKINISTSYSICNETYCEHILIWGLNFGVYEVDSLMVAGGLSSKSLFYHSNYNNYSENIFSITEMSVSYFMDEIVAIVPLPLRVPKWKVIFKIFTFSVWIFIISSLIFLTFVIWIVLHPLQVPYFQQRKSLLSIFFRLLNVSLSGSVKELPYFKQQRRILAILVFSYFVLTSSFQCLLVSFLTEPLYERETYDLDKILNSKGKFCYNAKNDILMPTNDDSIIKYTVHERVDSVDCYKKLVKERTPYFGNLPHIEYYAPLFLQDNSGKPLYNILEQRAHVYPISLFYKKANALIVNDLSSLIYGLVEGGVLDKWNRDLTAENTRHHIIMNHPKGPNKISLKDIQSSFYILLIGYIISVLFFVLERILTPFH